MTTLPYEQIRQDMAVRMMIEPELEGVLKGRVRAAKSAALIAHYFAYGFPEFRQLEVTN